MNNKMKTTVIAICVSLFSSAAMAQTALQQLQFQAGDDAVSSAANIQTPHAAIQPGGELVSIPMNAKDVFAQCQALNEKAMADVEWTLPQAVGVMQHCLDKSYNQEDLGFTVTAEASRFGVKMCPQSAGRLSCQAIMEVEGIKISVRGDILTGNPVLMDLNYSLNKRGGSLLGFKTIVESQATILK